MLKSTELAIKYLVFEMQDYSPEEAGLTSLEEAINPTFKYLLPGTTFFTLGAASEEAQVIILHPKAIGLNRNRPVFLELNINQNHCVEKDEVFLPVIINTQGQYILDPFALRSELEYHDMPPIIKQIEKAKLQTEIRELHELNLGNTEVCKELEILEKIL